MYQIVLDNKVIRFSGYRIEGDYVFITFGKHSIRIPLSEWEQLDIKEV